MRTIDLEKHINAGSDLFRAINHARKRGDWVRMMELAMQAQRVASQLHEHAKSEILNRARNAQ